MFTLEDVMNSSCIKSRTRYVINISNFPIIWVSRLQTGIAGSTMEAVYNVLSIAMRDVILIQDLIKVIGSNVGLEESLITIFKTTIWGDSMGCLKLASLEQ